MCIFLFLQYFRVPHRETFRQAEEWLRELRAFEAKLKAKNVILPTASPAYTHQVLFRKLLPLAYPFVNQGLFMSYATTIFAKK